MRKIRCVNLMMALALLLVLVPSVVSATPLAQEEQPYTVQKGDNLWTIAEKFLSDGDRYDEIVAATNAKHEEDATFAQIDNPRLIQPGWKLLIPGATVKLEPLDVVWVAITYQAPDGSDGKVFYRVDSVQFYPLYDTDTIKGRWPSATVQLALVVIPEHEEWQLLYPETARPVAESIATEFSGWSEYLFVAEPERTGGVESGAVGEPGLLAADLYFRKWPKQTISSSTAFVDSDGDGDLTISDFEDDLSRRYLPPGVTKKLLLAETVAGEPKYTLVIIDPNSPSPGDEQAWWCTICPICCGW